MKLKYDFSGWATKNDIKCSDGRIIRENAFIDNDGEIVPVVWNHQHNDGFNVLGHAMLKNTNEGVRAFITFNEETEQGVNAKRLVSHGDVRSLSIFANNLKQRGSDVLHGMIREVSLVLAGANPGARIDPVEFAHGEGFMEDAAIICMDLPLELYHSENEEEVEVEEESTSTDTDDSNTETELHHAEKEDEKKDESSEDSEKGETVQDVFDTLTEKQKTVVYAVIGAALEGDNKKEDDEENKEMKHNLFENEATTASNTLSHADEQNIIALSKKSGSFQDAFNYYVEENGFLQHDNIADQTGGFPQTGDGNVTWLFPEYKDVRPGEPELITNDQGWITTVLNKVHKSPFSRIRTRQVDIRNIDALRAKGYVKGDKKALTGNFNLVRRTTDPQTVYVKNALNKDDITDITDFDYVNYLYKIDKMMLNEELATAIMLGDGREEGADYKIEKDHIRPIWLDDELYTIHYDLDIAAAKAELNGTNTGANFGENYIYAEAMVNAVLYAREKYKGSGSPDMYIDPHVVNIMLLARDMNGRRIYGSIDELKSALNVNSIITAEQFAGKTRETANHKTKKLLALIVNLQDYSLGSTKGGEVSHYTQFDIDYNQEKSLIETRVSGALTRVYSAIAIEEEVNPN